MSFLLGRKTREQVFEPAFNDLIAAHLRAQEGKFQKTWARRWIKFCFGFRTAILLAECAIVGIRRLLLPRGLERLWERLIGP
jgi:hypothetical protein